MARALIALARAQAEAEAGAKTTASDDKEAQRNDKNRGAATDNATTSAGDAA